MLEHEIKFAAFVNARKWTFAKTMANIPHEYTLDKWAPEQTELFKEAESIIKEHGTDEAFFKRKFRYLHFDGHKYWAMSIGDGTRIINRAKI